MRIEKSRKFNKAKNTTGHHDVIFFLCAASVGGREKKLF